MTTAVDLGEVGLHDRAHEEHEARQRAEEAECLSRRERAEELAEAALDRHQWREVEELLGATWFREQWQEQVDCDRDVLEDALCEALSMPARDPFYNVRLALRKQWVRRPSTSDEFVIASQCGFAQGQLRSIALAIREPYEPPEMNA